MHTWTEPLKHYHTHVDYLPNTLTGLPTYFINKICFISLLRYSSTLTSCHLPKSHKLYTCTRPITAEVCQPKSKSEIHPPTPNKHRKNKYK